MTQLIVPEVAFIICTCLRVSFLFKRMNFDSYRSYGPQELPIKVQKLYVEERYDAEGSVA